MVDMGSTVWAADGTPVDTLAVCVEDLVWAGDLV